MTWEKVFELVDLARAGDRQAYGELVERFQPVVYALALERTRNANEAQELTQEVFIHAMTKLDQLREPHAFVSWLRQITVRMAINRMTRRSPFLGSDPEMLNNTAQSGDTPLEEMVRDENRAEVLKGLDQLKSLDKETLIQFYLRGKTLKEMSREFRTPVGTIKRRLHVARNRLREQLEEAQDDATVKPTRKKRGQELAGV